jgi:hypothetical protein
MTVIEKGKEKANKQENLLKQFSCNGEVQNESKCSDFEDEKFTNTVHNDEYEAELDQ